MKSESIGSFVCLLSNKAIGLAIGDPDATQPLFTLNDLKLVGGTCRLLA